MIEAIKNNKDTFLLLNKKLTEDKDIITLAGLDSQVIKNRACTHKDFKKHLPKGEK